jgi:aspartokinase
MSRQAAMAGILTKPQALLVWVEFRRTQGRSCGGLLGTRHTTSSVRPPGVESQVRRDLAVASLVGEGILARPALLMEALASLAEAQIEVTAARSGSLSLSFVVSGPDAAEAVRLLHDRFVAAES